MSLASLNGRRVALPILTYADLGLANSYLDSYVPGPGVRNNSRFNESLVSLPILYEGGRNFYFLSQLYVPGPGICSY
jgi:hypothetical protein